MLQDISPSPRTSKLPTVLDLFSGVGGFSLAAARAGFNVALAADIDQRCLHAHQVNFPNSAHFLGDLSFTSAETMLASAGLRRGQVDGIIGGPPCQGFSVLGRHKTDDPRNLLIEHYFRLVDEVRPKFFVMENVPGLVSDKHVLLIRSLLRKVSRTYRIVGPLLLSASKFGAPTTRTRAFIFGFDDRHFRSSITAADLTAGPTTQSVVVGEALKGLPGKLRDSLYRRDRPGEIKLVSMPHAKWAVHLTSDIPIGVGNVCSIERLVEGQRVSGMHPTAHSEVLLARYSALVSGETDTISRSMRLHSGGFCPTLRAGTGPERGSFQAVRPIHHREARVITPREGARLQGFPDWYQFHHTIWHSFRMIGNSVCPIVAKAVLTPVARSLL